MNAIKFLYKVRKWSNRKIPMQCRAESPMFHSFLNLVSLPFPFTDPTFPTKMHALLGVTDKLLATPHMQSTTQKQGISLTIFYCFIYINVTIFITVQERIHKFSYFIVLVTSFWNAHLALTSPLLLWLAVPRGPSQIGWRSRLPSSRRAGRTRAARTRAGTASRCRSCRYEERFVSSLCCTMQKIVD